MFKPNIHWVSLYSEVFEKKLRVKATQRALRTIDKLGGVDNYLLQTKNMFLNSKTAQYLKKKVKKQIFRRKEKDYYYSVVEYNAKLLAQHMKEKNPELANWETTEDAPEHQVEIGKRMKQAIIDKIQSRQHGKYLRGNRKIVKNIQTRFKHYKPWAANAYVEENKPHGIPAIIPVTNLRKENGTLFRG